MSLFGHQIWSFLVAHQGYLALGLGSPVLKQAASGNGQNGRLQISQNVHQLDEWPFF